LRVPPLRDRRVEILPWAHRFIASAAQKLEVAAPELTAAAVAVLESHEWPGNLRELRNAMERAVLSSAGASIDAEHVRLMNIAPAGAALRQAGTSALSSWRCPGSRDRRTTT
jgi:DNA-binding NtrC family response regulator